MSDRHMHITGYLGYEDGAAIERFTEAAKATGFFIHVEPVRYGDSTIAVALFSKDLDGVSDLINMPDIAEKLSGILVHDMTIASSWELPGYHDEGRQSAFLVRGTGERPTPGQPEAGGGG